MQFLLEPAQQMEVTSVEVQERAILSEPLTLKGQHILKAAYLTATGTGGAEAKAVVLFNANTGDFTIQRVDGEPVRKFAFDLPKAEFESKRKAKKAAATAGGQKTQANRNGDKDNETAD
jgi:hypothetical protein